MAHFYVWETVDFPIHLTPKEALQDYDHIIVSIGQGQVLINKSDDELGIDVDEGLINIHLSQEETGKFVKGKAELQVNIYYTSTERDTSVKAKIDVKDNLYKEVMTDE